MGKQKTKNDNVDQETTAPEEETNLEPAKATLKDFETWARAGHPAIAGTITELVGGFVGKLERDAEEAARAAAATEPA